MTDLSSTILWESESDWQSQQNHLQTHSMTMIRFTIRSETWLNQFSRVSGSTKSDWLSWEPRNGMIAWCYSLLTETETGLNERTNERFANDSSWRTDWRELVHVNESLNPRHILICGDLNACWCHIPLLGTAVNLPQRHMAFHLNSSYRFRTAVTVPERHVPFQNGMCNFRKACAFSERQLPL
jgi:hypothetical protein